MSTLSIVIPAYNEERTIHLILDKVRQVTMPAGWQKEIIIVNDCSKDNTEGAIKKYMGEHPDFPMRYIAHEVNKYLILSQGVEGQNDVTGRLQSVSFTQLTPPTSALV